MKAPGWQRPMADEDKWLTKANSWRRPLTDEGQWCWCDRAWRGDLPQPFAWEGIIFHFYEYLRPFAQEGFIFSFLRIPPAFHSRGFHFFISTNTFGLSLERVSVFDLYEYLCPFAWEGFIFHDIGALGSMALRHFTRVSIQHERFRCHASVQCNATWLQWLLVWDEWMNG